MTLPEYEMLAKSWTNHMLYDAQCKTWTETPEISLETTTLFFCYTTESEPLSFLPLP